MDTIVYPISEHDDLCDRVGPVDIDTVYGYGYAYKMLGWCTTVSDRECDDWDNNSLFQRYSATYEEAVIEHEKQVTWCEKYYNTLRDPDWGNA